MMVSVATVMVVVMMCSRRTWLRSIRIRGKSERAKSGCSMMAMIIVMVMVVMVRVSVGVMMMVMCRRTRLGSLATPCRGRRVSPIHALVVFGRPAFFVPRQRFAIGTSVGFSRLYSLTTISYAARTCTRWRRYTICRKACDRRIAAAHSATKPRKHTPKFALD